MKEKIKQPMSKGKIALLAVISIVALVIIIYLIYYLFHVVLNKGYKKYLTDYEYEVGTTYKPLSDKDVKVPGYDLVAENEILKLYTDTKTGYVAVYDKRNGSVTYSNPLDADTDPLAKNKSLKGYMKSAFILDYYNSVAKVGTYSAYDHCVAKNQMTYESIQNGVRYLYTIGDYKPESASAIYFEIPLDYRLDGDSVVVNIPTGHIKEDGAGFVYNIKLLQYFGAASTEETGYLVVPNGSGSLIEFNNGKKDQVRYSQYFYSIDPLVESYTSLENVDPVKLSLWGICREDRSLLVNVEKGATIAALVADISGRLNSYNSAYATFYLRNADNLKNYGDSATDVFVMEKDLYNMNLQVRYTFLTEENKGYAGIANFMRNKLISEGVLTAKTEDGDIPFYYDIISGIRATNHVLGKLTYRIQSMTSFKEAGEIAEDLQSLGVKKQVMNLQGWFNKGVNHNMPDKIKVTGKLGGKHGLEELNETLKGVNGKLYVDVAFQKVSFGADFDYNIEGARYYGAGYAASFGLTNPTTLRNIYGLGYSENLYDIMSPKYLSHYVEKFAKKIGRYDVDGISLRDLGSYLSSDKKRNEVIDREQALEIVCANLNKLEETGKSLLINEANDYAFGYAENILNAPMEDNDYPIIDERIPLYEMIVHGCIDYSSNLLNFDDSPDLTPTLLKLIENGAAPHYVFTEKNSSEMKNTAMNRYYATTYETWKDEAVDAYAFVNDALKHVSGACIVDHVIEGDLRKIVYDNGVTIYVNYGKSAGTIDGIKVSGLSYRVEGTK